MAEDFNGLLSDLARMRPKRADVYAAADTLRADFDALQDFGDAIRAYASTGTQFNDAVRRARHATRGAARGSAP